MGLASTQTLGPILDGLMRHTPDANHFIEMAGRKGVSAMVAARDSKHRGPPCSVQELH
jgi:enoyl-CoA hydratase